jgi:S-adenosylmethionine/arginine decarboxylase-like enzyme
MVDTIQVQVPAPQPVVPWGFHGIFDCSECDLDKIQSADNIKSWLSALLVAIDMTPIGDPIVAMTGVGMPDKEGYTAIQIIVTSSIVAHFIDSTKHIYIDVFSCKEFDPTKVEDNIKTFFGTNTKINKMLIPRNAALQV